MDNASYRDIAGIAIVPLSGGRRLTEGEGGIVYCIPCAVAHPEFRERAPFSLPTPFDEGDLPKAWISGKGYSLRHRLGAGAPCVSCGRQTKAAYCPENR